MDPLEILKYLQKHGEFPKEPVKKAAPAKKSPKPAPTRAAKPAAPKSEPAKPAKPAKPAPVVTKKPTGPTERVVAVNETGATGGFPWTVFIDGKPLRGENGVRRFKRKDGAETIGRLELQAGERLLAKHHGKKAPKPAPKATDDLCMDCGQPMLPSGVKKVPGEYDHASGCPRAPAPKSSKLDLSVDELEASVRLANCLQNAEIYTLGDLVKWSAPQLLKTKNFGMKTLNEARSLLAEIGLALHGEKVKPSAVPVRPWKDVAEEHEKTIAELKKSVKKTNDMLGNIGQSLHQRDLLLKEKQQLLDTALDDLRAVTAHLDGTTDRLNVVNEEVVRLRAQHATFPDLSTGSKVDEIRKLLEAMWSKLFLAPLPSVSMLSTIAAGFGEGTYEQLHPDQAKFAEFAERVPVTPGTLEAEGGFDTKVLRCRTCLQIVPQEKAPAHAWAEHHIAADFDKAFDPVLIEPSESQP